MQALVYYLTLPIIYGISILPKWWLYRLSDFLYFIVYRILKYRRDVVLDNFRHAFPDKSVSELQELERRYYEFFCDLIVETIKTLTISHRAATRYVSIENEEVIRKYFEQDQSVVVALGHLGNWELGGSRFANMGMHQLYVIYHPLRNRYFERLTYHMRVRLGNRLYTMKKALKDMQRDSEDLTATAFIADQAPARKNVYWTEFLHQKTPFFTGIGRAAKSMNYPVVYIQFKRPQRGKYVMSFTDLVPDPENHTADQIIQAFVTQLEHDIRKSPETWLWTHKRWKHLR